MRTIIAILILLNTLLLQGRDPHFGINKKKSFNANSSGLIKPVLSFNSITKETESESNTIISLIDHFNVLQKEIYRKERYLINSRFSGRIKPLLKATNIKLSYREVVVSVPFNQTTATKNAFLLNSSPFFSVLLNRASIYSDLYRFHSDVENRQPQSLHDLGLSIGAGIRLPITSKIQLDVGVRDELGLLNLDGFILGKYRFSQNNSLGVTLGLKYKI
jgi:hypothetical protein